MINLIIRWILNSLALWVVAYFVPGFHYRDWIAIALAAAVLGLLNAVVRPILYVLTLPITILTLGLFLIVLNALMLKVTAGLVPGFAIDSWFSAILGALLLSVVTIITNALAPSKEERR